MIIDAHCHIYPDPIAQKAANATDRFYETLTSYADGKVSTLLKDGARAGISHFVVQSVATNPAQVSSINRFIAREVEQSAGKFTGLGTLHPDSPTLKEDFEELLSLGLKGVKLHPDIQRFKIDDHRCLKIYELCEGKVPILMHTGDFRFDFSNPNRLLPVLRIFEGLVVIGAHFGGWSVWDDVMENLKDLPNLYVDTSSTFPFVDESKAKALFAHFGCDRILFGTDYPMWKAEDELASLSKMNLSESDQEKVLWRNAAKLFSIQIN